MTQPSPPDTGAVRALLGSLAELELPRLAARNAFLQQRIATFREAAVLLGVVPHQNRWHIVLTRRSAGLRHHTGQIALPGGRRDPQDSDLTATALREAHEEIGTPPQVWQTFAPLAALHSPSGFAVSAVPALSLSEPALMPSENEVAETFYLPLQTALDPQRYRIRAEYAAAPFPIYELPFKHYDIWGLTAGILYALSEANRRHHFFPLNESD